MLAGGLALALTSCRYPTDGLVLGDQVHLIESKLAAAHALDGVGYKLSFANFQGLPLA
jgi:sulfonate transport system substrate-binding protein